MQCSTSVPSWLLFSSSVRACSGHHSVATRLVLIQCALLLPPSCRGAGIGSIADVFPPNKRGLAIGILLTSTLCGPVVGPLIGMCGFVRVCLPQLVRHCGAVQLAVAVGH